MSKSYKINNSNSVCVAVNIHLLNDLGCVELAAILADPISTQQAENLGPDSQTLS